MPKRGMKPLGKTKREWSPEFAYAIGLLVTDGSLSKSGRHIDFTSKDIELIDNFQNALGISHKVTKKSSGKGTWAFRVQFCDVLFYRFLLDIGFITQKTKTIGALQIPQEYFFDFLRGHHDGDGSFYSYWDPRWKSSFMYYLTFISSSAVHLRWVQKEIERLIGIRGTVNSAKNTSCYHLRYAKKESLKLLRKMYPSKKVMCLSRKRLKIEQALSIVVEQL